jgi:DUF1009 family protein
MSPIIVISGKGGLPLQFKQLAEKRGFETYTVGIKGITDRTTDFTVPFLGFLELEELLNRFNNPKLVLLGKFDQRLPWLITNSLLTKLKVKLFGGRFRENYQVFLTLKSKFENGQPHKVVKVIIEHFEYRGYKFLPSEEIKEILKPLFAEEGNMTPTVEFTLSNQLKEFFRYTKTIADMDIGQTLVVKNHTVLAVEGAEGTNETLKRACKLGGKGFVMLKAARTYQDYRIDIPAVGLETLGILKKCRASAVILESGKVLIADKETFLKEAERNKIAVIGLTPR